MSSASAMYAERSTENLVHAPSVEAALTGTVTVFGPPKQGAWTEPRPDTPDWVPCTVMAADW
ncbi:hypothetical protein [Kitasatospora sp. NPDC089509]|uniref:hypothetical protein n=1 Tax=Kitasatospora sp. NPDC089509 TaxID=3364079 RepID=UPI003803AA9C